MGRGAGMGLAEVVAPEGLTFNFFLGGWISPDCSIIMSSLGISGSSKWVPASSPTFNFPITGLIKGDTWILTSSFQGNASPSSLFLLSA